MIVGIGINVRPVEFPDDLKDIAGSFSLKKPGRNELAGRLADELIKLYRDIEDDSFLQEYLKYSMHPEKVKEELGITD